MDLDQDIYPGGFYSLMKSLERKEAAFDDPMSVLPAPDCDLHHIAARILPPQPQDIPEGDRYSPARKWVEMRNDFPDQSELLALHGLTIAILRRRDPPETARLLFLRMWAEHGTMLARTLPTRWLISAATGFGDHGDTIEQRLGGQGLSMLFDLIKLHDSERRLSGRANDRPFPRVKGRPQAPSLAFDMAAYSLPRGDLDRFMLARLWRFAEQDAVLRPLGFRMLRLVMHDKRSIFGRIQRYKKRDTDDLG